MQCNFLFVELIIQNYSFYRVFFPLCFSANSFLLIFRKYQFATDWKIFNSILYHRELKQHCLMGLNTKWDFSRKHIPLERISSPTKPLRLHVWLLYFITQLLYFERGNSSWAWNSLIQFEVLMLTEVAWWNWQIKEERKLTRIQFSCLVLLTYHYKQAFKHHFKSDTVSGYILGIPNTLYISGKWKKTPNTSFCYANG